MSSAASSMGDTKGNSSGQFFGTGRRRDSVARVYIRMGAEKFTVNGRPVEDYFKNVAWLTSAVEPLKFTETQQQLEVKATVKGGGVGGQAGAIRMGLSRAIARFNPELRPGLRKNGFLTRDSRMKERKKYGQKGARRRFQFSKR
ncbi:MAG: 30S ribosomal protein S9 [Candidatus Acidiferrales bacterium]